MRRAYQSDLSDAEWSFLEPYFPAPKVPGRPRVHPLREITDAIFYSLQGGHKQRGADSKYHALSRSISVHLLLPFLALRGDRVIIPTRETVGIGRLSASHHAPPSSDLGLPTQIDRWALVPDLGPDCIPQMTYLWSPSENTSRSTYSLHTPAWLGVKQE